MITWISQNISTILVATIVFGLVALVIISYFKDKKKNKNRCAGCAGCACCAYHNKCTHAQMKEKKI